MAATSLGDFLALTIGLIIGVGAASAAVFRADIARNWKQKRCEPGVIPIAGAFKPADDPRTKTEFAQENWRHCQKEYVQNAVRMAAEAPKALATAEEDVVAAVGDITDTIGNVFVGVWRFCYEAYSTFLDRMKGTAKLMHNFMINLHMVVGRLQAAALSIVYGLIALVVSILNSVQVILIVAIVIIGILLALQIILFFVLLPISGLIITITAIISVTVVVVATAIAASMVAEMFTPGVCFEGGTLLALKDGRTAAIRDVALGDVLVDGGRITAIHRFMSSDSIYNLHGIRVSGDHLVVHGGRLIPVREHPEAAQEKVGWFGPASRELWCLTTTTRRILCVGRERTVEFADWEEIPDSDEELLRSWDREVQAMLNGVSHGTPLLAGRAIDSEAGLAPDCLVQIVDWTGCKVWRRVMDVGVGTRIVEGLNGGITTVVGRVELAGDQVKQAVNLGSGEHGPQIVSLGSWVQGPRNVWEHPTFGSPCKLKPGRWIHLYTKSGKFMVSGGWQVRDASDVGLERLRPLVESVVL
jgi:hypothetical protein